MLDFFAYENIKKLPWKVTYLKGFDIFSSAAPTAPNSPKLKIHTRNVAQDTSVYCSVKITVVKVGKKQSLHGSGVLLVTEMTVE